MKLKYYLRGLGIGIIVTAIILTIANFGKEKPLTDAQIIERAKELGMIQPGEEDESSKQLPETGIDDGETDNKKEGNRDGVSDGADAGGSGNDNKADTQKDMNNDEEAKEVMSQQPEQPQEQPTYVEIVVSPGEFSDSISQKLFQANLVANADEFNHYLTDNRIDGLLAVGVHQIPQGAGYEEIARILCEKPENQ